MKKQMPTTRSQVTPPIPLRHQLEHEIPTVIHHPEEQMTALGRVAFHVMQDPRKYSTWALAGLLGILAIVVVSNFSSGRSSRDAEAWTKLEAAKKAEDRVEVAKEYPRSPVSTWALLQAATEYHNLALADLPNNHDVALGYFKKALDLFNQVEKEAPKDSFQARAAAWGKARSFEAKSDLPKAIEEYERIAKTWPDTPEAAQAKELAESLKQPEAMNFYRELYTYAPTKVTLPPLGTDILNLPSTGVNPPGSMSTVPPLPTPLVEMPLDVSPPTAIERAKVEEVKPAKAAVTPAPAPAPKAESTAKTDASKVEKQPVELVAPTDGKPKEKTPR